MSASGASSSGPTTRSDEGSNPSARMTRFVKREMGDTWRHEPKFFKKFFSINLTIKGKIPDIKKKYYNHSDRRWSGIVAKIKSAASLSTKLLHILNGMLDDDLKKSRLYFKSTKSLKVYTGRKTVTTPSIFLAGSGREFPSTALDLPFAQYAQGIAPFEVRLQSSNDAQGRGRLGAHAHEVFADQENRRFLFGVVLTQHTMTVYMFDRSGALFSDPLDYHANPDQFCAVILGLAIQDPVSAGFDSTIYLEEGRAKVRTKQSDGVRRTRKEAKLHGEGTVYTIKVKKFRPRTVVGKGTICWLVQDDRTEAKYIIKDCWIAPDELPGRESEAALLWHAQRQGITRGVAQIRHCENINVGKQEIPDTVTRNRQLRGGRDPTIERVHTRLVLSTYGKTLDEFSTPQEFLLAFYDAVLAHRNLFEKAGILHRDISVRNILIKSDGEEGDRGVLIDLDSAIRVGDESPYSTKRGIGTWPYKSRNVLNDGEHTYIDDLESFFYVLCFIVVGYTRPSTLKVPRSGVLEAWEGTFARIVKHGWITSEEFDLHVSDWFGEAIRKLCGRLFSFFEGRSWDAREAREDKRTPPAQIPAVDYDEFLAHIRQAVSDIETNDPRAGLEESKPPSPHDGALEATRHSIEFPKPRRPKSPEGRLPPISRPRRTTAKYG